MRPRAESKRINLVKSAKLKQDVQYLRWPIIKVIIGWYVYTHYKVVTIATHRVMRRPAPVLLCYAISDGLKFRAKGRRNSHSVERIDAS